MTVSSGAAKAGPYTGNDLVSSFAFGFKVFADSDIRVVETLISTEAETDLVLNTNYTVTRNVDQDTNPGGTVTYKVAGVTTALPSTKKLTIVGDFVYEQPTDIPNGGAFFANIVENALDRLTLLTKQIKERVDRSVVIGVSSSLDPDTIVADFLTAVADAETAAASAAASLDSFDDRYLGPKASDPSTDNDGAPLTAGVFYWSTTSGVMRAYNGSAWVDAVTATPSNLTADTFSGTGAQTAFTLSATPPSVQSCVVFISGVRQRPTTDYTVAGTTLTFATPPASGSSNISVLTVSALGIGEPGDGTVTSAKLAPGLSLGGGGGFANKIIGGDFSTNPWQRGTSFVSPASGAYTADRWSWVNTSAAAVSVLKTADAPTVAAAGVYTQHCLHVDVTTADASIAAGDLAYMTQKVEGFNAAEFGFGQAGTRYITLSFWHKHTKTGTYCVALGNSAANRSYVAEYTQSVTDTWEKATVTIPVDTSGTWLYDTGIGVQVSFAIAAGSTYQTTAGAWAAGNFFATANQVNDLDNTANNFKIALVQLEEGQTATTFSVRSIQEELVLCQRYYFRFSASSVDQAIGFGYCFTTSQAFSQVWFPTSMRIPPTALEQSGTASHFKVVYQNTSAVCSSVPAFAKASLSSAEITLTCAAVFTVGQGCLGRADSTSAYLGFSAEL